MMRTMMGKTGAGGGDRYQSLVKQLSSRKGIVKASPLAVEAGKRKYGVPRIPGMERPVMPPRISGTPAMVSGAMEKPVVGPPTMERPVVGPTERPVAGPLGSTRRPMGGPSIPARVPKRRY